MKALREARLAPIGGAERVPESRDPANMMAPGASAERNRLGAEFFADCEQPLRNLVERLIPGNSLPLSRAACAGTAQRVRQTIGMIDQVERDGSDRAQSAMIERGLAIAFDFDKTVAFDVQQYPATAVTAAADAFKDLCRLTHEERNCCAASGARLIHARRRQSSSRNLRHHQNEELEHSIGSRDLRGRMARDKRRRPCPRRNPCR